MTPPMQSSTPARGSIWAGFIVFLFILCLPTVSGRADEEPPPSVTPSPAPSQTVAYTPSSTTTPEPLPSQTPGWTPSLTVTASVSPTPTIDFEDPVLPSPGSSPTPSASVSASPSPSADQPASPAYAPGSILISEVAWAGTSASPHDEWIELYNPGGHIINLQGWTLTDHDDIQIQLNLSIAPYSFALLERTDDTTIANIAADQIYTGSLKNSGDALFLLDPSGNRVDSANKAGGVWPCGESASRASMERRGGDDQAGNWTTFAGVSGAARDRDGHPVLGTPRAMNAVHAPIPTTATPLGTQETPTPSVTATRMAALPITFESGDVVINEVAWAGTDASASDEWIELHNPGGIEISLEGWRLHDGGDLSILLGGTLPPHAYFLLERTDDQTVADIPADLIYSGSLANSGETLSLRDPHGTLIDSANADGGAWPAGNAKQHASMERRGGQDRRGNWTTFTGYHGAGIDAAGRPIQGTPRQVNSVFLPTPQPTWIPGKVVINEVLIRPHYDWEGVGGVDTGDEFIELLNLGPFPVNLRGWMLDDIEDAGSKPYNLPSKTLAPGELIAYFRSRTRIALNDGGDTARLLAPDGSLVDQLAYLRTRAYNLSYGRLPDGSGRRFYGLWPTPGEPNMLFEEPSPPAKAGVAFRCRPVAGFPLTITRIARQPMILSWLSSTGIRLCWQSP